jgi:hypothetical protein
VLVVCGGRHRQLRAGNRAAETGAPVN